MVRDKNRKNKKNYATRFVAILFVALTVNLASYRLPDSILGLQIKKVDLLSDIRERPEENVDRLPTALIYEDDGDGDDRNSGKGNGNGNGGDRNGNGNGNGNGDDRNDGSNGNGSDDRNSGKGSGNGNNNGDDGNGNGNGNGNDRNSSKGNGNGNGKSNNGNNRNGNSGGSKGNSDDRNGGSKGGSKGDGDDRNDNNNGNNSNNGGDGNNNNSKGSGNDRNGGSNGNNSSDDSNSKGKGNNNDNSNNSNGSNGKGSGKGGGFTNNSENIATTPVAVAATGSTIQLPVPPDYREKSRHQKVISDPAVTEDTGAERGSVSTKTAGDDKHSTDYLSTDIEDFSSGHTGLRRFFSALNNVNNLGRPVRIAFLGDSFIEGDVMVADFRAIMQANFGGRGVGFIPVASNVAQYRPTIKQSADGWKTYSIIKNKSRKYVLSGLQFEPVSDNASIRFQTVDTYPGLEEVSSIKFIYSNNENTGLLLKNDSDTSYYYELPPTESVVQFEIKGQFTQGTIRFKNATGLHAIGFAFEDNRGVIVDNFSLRGNSGVIMSEIDGKSCRELQQIRPYDLIILQYGLNVASDSVREYGWYRNQMIAVIEHLQDCFPEADVLMLGVSDCSRKHDGSYSTMPAVLSLLRAQRQTAKRTEIAFWSIFAAMGGRNSMVKYVNSNWASKDYTHLSFRGGREVAKALFDAIITEKNRYDEDERVVER
jgi:hypothetical protein